MAKGTRRVRPNKCGRRHGLQSQKKHGLTQSNPCLTFLTKEHHRSKGLVFGEIRTTTTTPRVKDFSSLPYVSVASRPSDTCFVPIEGGVVD